MGWVNVIVPVREGRGGRMVLRLRFLALFRSDRIGNAAIAVAQM